MKHALSIPVLLLLAVALFTGCPGPDDDLSPCGECAANELCDLELEACVIDLPELCTAGTRWVPGTPAFQLADWGLEGLGAAGVRVGAVDLDDDGRAELIVRRAGDQEATQVSSPGSRVVWLLKNTGDETGVSFEDVTAASGLFTRRDGDGSRTRPAEIAIFADVNGDGHLDAYTAGGASGGSNETAELLLGDGALGFQLGSDTNPSRQAGAAGNPIGASFLDASLDGRVDLFVGTSEQDRFYVGLGTDELVEATDREGLTTQPWAAVADLNAGLAHTTSWSTLACDLDGDGYSELLSSSYGRAPNHLWLNRPGADGTVTFENQSVSSGYAYDENLDWTDNQSARCHCQLHRSDPDCTGVPNANLIRCSSDADVFRWNHTYDREPFRLGGNSGTALCADLNGDGAMDLVTTEIVHWDVGANSDHSEVLFNTGETPLRFERPGRAATGVTRSRGGVDFNEGDMTAAAFDFDNDGALDLYIGDSDYPDTRGLLYHQDTVGHFESVPLSEGIDQLRSHGMGVSDFDRDGDLDLVVGHSRSRCSGQCYPTFEVRAWENRVGQDGNWLQLDLRDPTSSNTRAIGARIILRTDSGEQLRQLDGGHGQGGIQHDLVQHFGLGADCRAEVEIHWPAVGSEPEVRHLPAGYRFRITRGAGVEVL